MRTLLILLTLVAASKAAVEVPIDDHERVVHLIGTPFNHVYYEPRMEALLLRGYADRGLIYRRVNAGRNLAELLKNLESKVFIHRPTLVIVQCGIDDLASQSRQVEFDFQQYPKAIESLVQALRERRIKVVLCSPTPLGSASTREKLIFPLDGIKTWVDAARETADRHGASFVDLFSDALTWPMIGNHPKTLYQYDPEGHRKSWELFRQQLQFTPVPPEPAALSEELKKEFIHGHQLVEELEAVENYQLPAWIKLPTYPAQKDAARQAVLTKLDAHDRRVRELAGRP